MPSSLAGKTAMSLPWAHRTKTQPLVPFLMQPIPVRVPGGSSGGSAVAVQAGLCLASIGSDTGGSVRQPAAFCGVVGLKPTYGRISRWGLIAYASSFDCIGPIANTVDDAALLLEIMAGADEFDSTVSSQPVSCLYHKQHCPTGHFALLICAMASKVRASTTAIREATQAKIDALQNAGHTVEPVDISLLKYLLPTYYILTTAEASSNLSRFDGVRYGYRSVSVSRHDTSALDLLSLYKKSRTEGFGAEVRRRILLGTFVLSASYYDAYYTKAQQVRRLIRQEAEQLFEQYDFLLSPTTPTPAFRLGEKTDVRRPLTNVPRRYFYGAGQRSWLSGHIHSKWYRCYWTAHWVATDGSAFCRRHISSTGKKCYA